MFVDRIINSGILTEKSDGTLILEWMYRTWEAKNMSDLKLQIRKFMGRHF